MSTNINHYVVQGIKLKPDQKEPDYDQFESYHDNWRKPFDHDKLYIVDDPMNGEFCIIGRIIARTNEFDGFEVVEVPPLDLASRTVLEDAIKRTFNIEGTAETYVFTVWS